MNGIARCYSFWTSLDLHSSRLSDQQVRLVLLAVTTSSSYCNSRAEPTTRRFTRKRPTIDYGIVRKTNTAHNTATTNRPPCRLICDHSASERSFTAGTARHDTTQRYATLRDETPASAFAVRSGLSAATQARKGRPPKGKPPPSLLGNHSHLLGFRPTYIRL